MGWPPVKVEEGRVCRRFIWFFFFFSSRRIISGANLGVVTGDVVRAALFLLSSREGERKVMDDAWVTERNKWV